jgi:alpha-galactosidase
MWAMMAAPLIAGNDLTRMPSGTRDILLNSEVIAIDQDSRGTPALIVHDDGGRQVWSRPLNDPAARAVALFNPTDASAAITVRWADIGLAPGEALVRDLWAHADRGVVADSFTATVEPHGTVMLKVTAQPYIASALPPPSDQPAPPVDAPLANQGIRYPYLSDLVPTFIDNGLGPPELDISNGEGGTGDGRAITLGDRRYTKGLGVHAPADVRYDLGGMCTAFAADIGLDAEVGAHGAAVFQVWADGTLIYDSGVLHGGMAPVPVYLSIPGIHELRLVVAPVEWVIDYAHADWADARVECR